LIYRIFEKHNLIQNKKEIFDDYTKDP